MHACFLLQRGLKTLPLRVRQQSANALALAVFLEKQAQVCPAILTHATWLPTLYLFAGLINVGMYFVTDSISIQFKV